jgi:hypothetical protein
MSTPILINNVIKYISSNSEDRNINTGITLICLIFAARFLFAMNYSHSQSLVVRIIQI